MLWFDPNAAVSIAGAAQAAYAASPDAALPVSQFKVVGGSVYAGAPGYGDRTWKPEALWMPRVSLAYKLGQKSVIKGGYGLYFDTLNARDWTPNQDGFSVTTTNPLSNDFGLTYALGDPRNGILPAGQSLPGAPQRQPVRDRSRQRARRQQRAGPGLHRRERQPHALPRAAVACGLAARAQLHDGDRGRLLGVVRRPPGHLHPAGLSAGAVLEQRQRPRHLGERLPDGERDEPVLHRDGHRAVTVLCRAAGLGPAARAAATGVDDVHVADHRSATVCCARSRR